MLKERAQEFQIGREKFEAVLDNNAQPVAQFLMFSDGLSGDLVTAFFHLLVKGEHDRLLGGEVVISAPERDTGLARDVAHGGLLETLLAEELQRRLVDATPRLFRLGGGT